MTNLNEAKAVPADLPESIREATRLLRAGKLVVLPTDTVYGLAAAYGRPDAIAHIFEVKSRPPERPIALLVDRIEDVELVAAVIPGRAKTLMQQFWPGGLTIILTRKPAVPDIVAAGGPTIAVRMPDHSVPRTIARQLGEPLPTTSANISGKPSPKNAAEAAAQIGHDVGLILDGGPARTGVDSTVVDMTVVPPVVTRIGAVSVEAIAAALGQKVTVAARM
jgi:tRNA threonylcarbamoyl adenosine modification protein (Sua5/YciO/YrdC/YwlC family)